MDLKCEFATIDVVSVLGTQQNVTQHVQKYPIDASGVRQRFQHRNLKQHDVELFDSTIEETIEELHADGEDAVSLDEDTLNIGKFLGFILAVISRTVPDFCDNIPPCE